MIKTPSFDALVQEYTKKLKFVLSAEGGFNDYLLQQKAWFQRGLEFLENDPDRILELAAKDDKAAEATLIACAEFLGSHSHPSSEARLAIAKLLVSYEKLKKRGKRNSRFKQNAQNFQIILMIFNLKNKYRISPTRGEGTSTKYSGCDIMAQVCVNINMDKPTSYNGVKRLWVDRHKYFPGYTSDEELFAGITRDLETYIRSIADADR